jgi:hypothetical protein
MGFRDLHAKLVSRFNTNIPTDTTKRLMSSPKCRSVEVINNPARPGSNHREVNCINYS